MKTFHIFNVQYQSRVAVLTLQEKRIYLNKSDQFREEVNQFLQSGEKNIIVDLSKVNVMNSSGLGVLIALQNEVENREGVLKIVGLQPLMQEIFSRMRLEQLFDLEKDLPEALKVMQK